MKGPALIVLISAILSQAACTPSSTHSPASSKTDREKAKLIGAVHTVTTRDHPFLKTERYDSSGNLIEQITDTIESSRGWPYISRYTYSADGKRLAETVPTIRDHKEMGSVYARTAYSYFGNGNLAAQVRALNDGSFTDATFYLYDEDGNETVILNIASDFLINRSEYEHGKHGNIIRESHYSTPLNQSPLALVWEARHSYNSDGHRTETLYYGPDLRFENRYVFKYSDRGELIEQTDYDANGTILRKVASTFQYDSVGNWTKKTSKVIVNPLNNEGKPRWRPENISDRTITYFD